MHSSQPVSRRLDLPDDLIPRLRAREEGAYRQLLDATFSRLVNFAKSIVHSTDSAEDVVQEVLVRIARQGEAFEPKGSLAAYLYTAVRNRALDVLKSHTREQHRMAKIAQDVDDDQNVPDSFAGVEEFMALLTERQRTAVHLRYVEHRTVPEISQILGVSITAVNQLLRRAIGVLRREYGP